MLYIKFINIVTLGGNVDNGIQKESKKVFVTLILCINMCIKNKDFNL